MTTSTKTTYTVLPPGGETAAATPQSLFALDVLHGLSESPKHLASKYLYDDAGSRLFQQITLSHDYYPTGCETEILTHHAAGIADAIGSEAFNLIELGAGDGSKTRLLIAELLKRGHTFNYVPIDISESIMQTLSETMIRLFPSLHISGLVADYLGGLRWLEETSGRRNLVLFLGSNIGNFTRLQSRSLLRNLWNALQHGDYLLTGFDLKKNIDVMLQAYNDSEGFTRAFNLNLLLRINRELGGHFDINLFRHYGTYNALSGAMESFLISRQPQTVCIDALQRAFAFEAFEPVHVEYSYKYLMSDIEGLASDTGFRIAANFSDSKNYFTDSLWQVAKL
ncbi:MAG: L-histidine N(alpha)-methyltransferase [Rhizobacter sp.]|nr:L-histidine N(alpha)-methyltransferase [Chlorobiales bacterium]